MSTRYPTIRKLGKIEALANHYGFPPCCYLAFKSGSSYDVIKQARSLPHKPQWLGTGFVPCADCANLAGLNFFEFYDKHIKPFRLSSRHILQQPRYIKKKTS